MNPLVACLLIALHPFNFARDLFHANDAIFILLVIFVALQTKNILPFNAVLLIL